MLLQNKKDKITSLDLQEATTLKRAIRIPMPTVIRKLLIFYLPPKRFTDTKEALDEITLKKTQERIEFIQKFITEEFSAKIKDSEKQKHLTEILRLTTLTTPPTHIKKWDVRWASRELKLLKQEIKNANSISGLEKKELLGNLENIRTTLSEELEDRKYKLTKAGDYYVKLKSEYKNLPPIYKFFFWFRQLHKTLSALLAILALVGGSLALLAMLFFPPLAATAILILTIASLGLCYCTIMLSFEQLIKWATDRRYFGLPFSKAQLLSGLIRAGNFILAIAFTIMGISNLIPASTTSTISYLPKFGQGINNIIQAGAAFLQNHIFLGPTVYYAYTIFYRTLLTGAGLGYFYDLSRTLLGMYQSSRTTNLSSKFIIDEPLIAPETQSTLNLSPATQSTATTIQSLKGKVSPTASLTKTSIAAPVEPKENPEIAQTAKKVSLGTERSTAPASAPESPKEDTEKLAIGLKTTGIFAKPKTKLELESSTPTTTDTYSGPKPSG